MAKQPYLPPKLPLLPVARPHVLYPFLQVHVPLTTDAVNSILATITDQADIHKTDPRDRIVAAVPVDDNDRRLGRWGCAARIKRIYRNRDKFDEYMCVLEGLTRVHLSPGIPPLIPITPQNNLNVASYSLPVPSPTVTVDLMPAATKLLPQELHAKLAVLPPTVQADLLASTLRFPWETRVELLGLPDADDRCARVKEVMVSLLAEKGTSLDEPTKGKGLVANSQRRPALSVPKSQMPDDLQPLEAALTRRRDELSPAAAETLVRELTRLSKLPPQAAEYGVSKTYCEWLLSLPWSRVTEGRRMDLEEARKLLDADHEGLKDVKRRVVEYLAVYRLKRELWDEKKKQDEDDAAKAAEVAEAENKGKKEVKAIMSKEDVEKAQTQMERSGDVSLPANTKREEAPDDAVEKKKDEDLAPLIDDGPPDNVFRDKAPILLLVGPPGVGKTSIARSIASALGRRFHRVSLGGVRDEAEIRGHRRTYVGALPGVFVQALRKVGVSNPVILLDEIDKVGQSNYHGDPSAALLETLDPAQNWSFHDHYLGDVTVDLSQVTFIATANSLDTISGPLLDRCEVIECPGYVTDEKLAIARRFLLPKQTKENGLSQGGVTTDDGVLARVVNDYTREAGVRSLEREIAKLCRAKAVEYSSSRDGGPSYNPVITVDDVQRILGMAKFDHEMREQGGRPGVVTGLAYMGSGNGGILLVECTLIPNGKGHLRLTGQLGDVIKESAELALAWVKAHSVHLGIRDDPLLHNDIHLHLPAGAVKKDGPSAGVAILLAFVSLLTGRTVPPTMGFTGEITLRGAVTAVGGIREKVLGAHRAGITQVCMPGQNEKDARELPESTKDMKIVYYRTVEEAIEEVWGRDFWAEPPRASHHARL